MLQFFYIFLKSWNEISIVKKKGKTDFLVKVTSFYLTADKFSAAIDASFTTTPSATTVIWNYVSAVKKSTQRNVLYNNVYRAADRCIPLLLCGSEL